MQKENTTDDEVFDFLNPLVDRLEHEKKTQQTFDFCKKDIEAIYSYSSDRLDNLINMCCNLELIEGHSSDGENHYYILSQNGINFTYNVRDKKVEMANRSSIKKLSDWGEAHKGLMMLGLISIPLSIISLILSILSYHKTS